MFTCLGRHDRNAQGRFNDRNAMKERLVRGVINAHPDVHATNDGSSSSRLSVNGSAGVTVLVDDDASAHRAGQIVGATGGCVTNTRRVRGDLSATPCARLVAADAN